MRFQLSLSNDFYLLHLHLNNCDGNDMRSDVLVKQFRFLARSRTLSLQICVRQTVRLTTKYVD